VLSKLSARKFGLSPWSWFHSLHATSHALHPMQMLVSVKKPYDSPALIAATSKTHQVGCDLPEALLARIEVKRDRSHLVHHRNRRTLGGEVGRRAFEIAQRRRAAARGAVTRVARATAHSPSLRTERLEHRSERGPCQIAVDHDLRFTRDPLLDHPHRLLRLQAVEELRPELVRTGDEADVDDARDHGVGDVGGE